MGAKNQVLQGVAKATRKKSARGRAARLFSSTPQPDTQNRDGFPAYTHDLRANVGRLALTGLIRDRFYTDKEEQAAEMGRLFVECAKSHPEFLLKAAKASRDSQLKLAPIVALVAAASHAPDVAAQHEAFIVSLLSTLNPNTLLQYVELFRTKSFGKGFGSRQQRWIRSVFDNVSDHKLETWTLKFGPALRTLGLLVHLKTDRPAFNYVMKGDGKGTPITDRQKAANAARLIKDPMKFAQHLVDNDIPWDCVKAFVPNSPVAFASMMMNAGINAVLLNTRSYEAHRVFESPEALAWYKDWAVNVMPKGRVLPLDIMKTWQHVEHPAVKSALLDGLAALIERYSTDEDIRSDARRAVLMDISGSMGGYPLQEQGVLAGALLLKATIPVFAAAFSHVLHLEGTDEFLGQDINGHARMRRRGWQGNQCTPCPQITGRSDWRQLLTELMGMYVTGGTDTGIGIAHMCSQHIVADEIFLFTDEQQNRGRGAAEMFRLYRKQVSPQAKLVIVNTSGNPWHNFSIDEPGVICFNAVHPQIFRMADNLSRDPVEAIESISLKPPLQ